MCIRDRLNSYANELCREAEIAGRIGTETTARLDRLNAVSYTHLDVYKRQSRFGAHQRACRLLPVKENRMEYTSGHPPD